MKTFLLSSLILVLAIILIIIFQNIASSLNGNYILFYEFTQSESAATFIIILNALGFIAGVLTTALAIAIINEGKDEEAPGGTNW